MLLAISTPTTTRRPGALEVSDYVFEFLLGEIALFKWDGADFTRRSGDPSSTLSLRVPGRAITISAAELGNTKQLRFSRRNPGIVFDPATGDPDFTNAKGDVAPVPGAGLYKYTVNIARPRSSSEASRDSGEAGGGKAVLDAALYRSLGHGCRHPERPGQLCRPRGAPAARSDRAGRRRRSGLHVGDPGGGEGQDVRGSVTVSSRA